MSEKEPLFTSQVIADGRVTIPRHVREKLGIKEGDVVTLLIISINFQKVSDAGLGNPERPLERGKVAEEESESG